MSVASCFCSSRFWRVKGPGLVLIVPVVQQFVARRLAGRGPRRADAGCDLARQCLGEGERGHLLPRDRSAECDHSGRELRDGDEPAGDRPPCARCWGSTARRDAGRARQAQRPYPADPRRADRHLGDQGRQCRAEADRPHREHDPCHCPPGGGGAAAPGQDHRRRGRAAGGREAVQAGEILARRPEAMQLRYLGTLLNIAGERSSTIVFPLPMELLRRSRRPDPARRLRPEPRARLAAAVQARWVVFNPPASLHCSRMAPPRTRSRSRRRCPTRRSSSRTAGRSASSR